MEGADRGRARPASAFDADHRLGSTERSPSTPRPGGGRRDDGSARSGAIENNRPPEVSDSVSKRREISRHRRLDRQIGPTPNRHSGGCASSAAPLAPPREVPRGAGENRQPGARRSPTGARRFDHFAAWPRKRIRDVGSRPWAGFRADFGGHAVQPQSCWPRPREHVGRRHCSSRVVITPVPRGLDRKRRSPGRRPPLDEDPVG